MVYYLIYWLPPQIKRLYARAHYCLILGHYHIIFYHVVPTDMYLIHWPMCLPGTENPKQVLAESWKALEELYQEGECPGFEEGPPPGEGEG